MRVTFVATEQSQHAGYHRYRCLHAVEQLAADGVDASIALLGEVDLIAKVSQSDVVILSRTPRSVVLDDVVAHARRRGALLLFDIDDLLFDESALRELQGLSSWSRSIEGQLGMAAAFKEALLACDGCIASTPFLAARVEALGVPSATHENQLAQVDVDQARLIHADRRRGGGRLTVGYFAGSSTHDDDLQSIAAPLAGWLREHRDASLLLAGRLTGAPQELLPYAERVHLIGWQDPRVYPWIAARCRAVVAPLETLNAFNRAKSAVKVFEAAILGVPAIASASDAYLEAIDDEKTGFIARGEQDWLRALDAVSDHAVAERIGDAAREKALSRHSPQANRGKLLATIRGIAERAKHRLVPGPDTRQLAVDERPARRRRRIGELRTAQVLRGRGREWLTARTIGVTLAQLSEQQAVKPPPPKLSGRVELLGAPAVWFRGHHALCRISITNDSPTTWPFGGPRPVRACFHWLRADGSMFIYDGERTPLAGDLAPGATTELTISVAVPDTTEPLLLELTLVAENHSWGEDAGFTTRRIAVDAIDLDAEAKGGTALLACPARVLASDTFDACVAIENQSNGVWQHRGKHALALALTWKSADAAQPVSIQRVPADDDVVPGARRAMRVAVRAPAAPGTYVLELTAVREQRCWLNDSKSFVVATKEVTVLPAAGDGAPRPEAARAMRDAARSSAEEAYYRAWLESFSVPSARDRERLVGFLAARAPVALTVIVPLPSSAEGLARTVDALRAQWLPSWRCLVVGRDGDDVRRCLGDERIELVSASSEDRSACIELALRRITDGLVMVLDQGDVLAPHALALICAEHARNAHADWLSFDEDRVSADGIRHRPVFLPPPSEEAVYASPLVLAHAAVRRDVLTRHGPLDGGVGAFALGIVAVRATASPLLPSWRHVPHVLLSRGTAGAALDDDLPTRFRAAETVRKVLVARGRADDVTALHDVPGLHVRWALPKAPPLASLIILSRDRIDLIRRCVESIVERTRYPSYEIVIVDHETVEPEARRYLDALASSGVARLMPYTGPFNWSAMNNEAAPFARGEVLVLLNNDVEVTHETWLTEMVSHAVRPEVGVVGAALWYSDNRLQHAGTCSSKAGQKHVAKELPRHSVLPPIVKVVGERSAVTGACMAMRRDVFAAAGPFDALHFPGPFNDVEYCWRVRERLGLRIVYTPHAELFHHESATRSETSEAIGAAGSVLNQAYRDAVVDDPTFSPNLEQPRAVGPASSPRASLRVTVNQLANPSRPSLAFVHIPKTAGSAFRIALEERLPSAVLVVDARENAECYRGDAAALARVRARASHSAVWISHIHTGFARLLGVEAFYGSILRDPYARLRSHWRHLQSDPHTPLRGELVSAPLEALLQHGVIPGNLMVRALAGGVPEDVTWEQIASRGLGAASKFVGFGMPNAVWTKQPTRLDALPVVGPDEDDALLEAAWDAIVTRYAFVGLQERLSEHMVRLAKGLDWGAFYLGIHNVGRASPEESSSNSATIASYTRLDRMLYDRIAARDGGLFVDDERLAQTAAFGVRER